MRGRFIAGMEEEWSRTDPLRLLSEHVKEKPLWSGGQLLGVHCHRTLVLLPTSHTWWAYNAELLTVNTSTRTIQ